jgi:chromosome segregation ATPase
MTDIHNTKSESYLPKAESPERPHLRIKSKDSDKSPSSIAKALISYQNQAQVAIEQVDRLRKALREKDMDLAVTKSENALLKQIERRYQKDMELQELHHQDAPRIIKGLRDEISHLKAKIKTYFSQLGEDSRTIRQMDEERRRLRDHSHRLETLVAQEQLEDRDSLCTKLNESLEEISRLQRTLSVS